MVETSVKNLFSFAAVMAEKIYKEKDIEEFYFGILNCFLHMVYDASHYCFCNGYLGCEDQYGTKKYCPLCRIHCDLPDFEKRLDKVRLDFDKLCDLATELLPYIKECFECGPYSIDELFQGEYCTYYRDNYTGMKTTTYLREQIEFDRQFKKY